MLLSIRTYTALMAIVLLGSFIGNANRAQAQTYQIDCAILLCLAGGWPASVPCTRARAEFIRRITPWPIEPPLQIWRCPMGATYQSDIPGNEASRIYDILATERNKPAPMVTQANGTLGFERANLQVAGPTPRQILSRELLQLAQDRADIDISGPEFDFVRSIRVYDVRYARQHESGRDGDCNRSATVYIGTYNTQGEFSWARSSPPSLPEAHTGLERWGYNCPSIYHRSVFVDWRDFEGNYGFVQVNY